MPTRKTLTPEQKKKLASGKCVMTGCNGKLDKYRIICYKCKTKLYRLRHPVNFYYNQLKKGSKRRCIKFTLTLDQFEQFCFDTNYIQKVEKCADGYSLDRIDVKKGYEFGNLQVLTLSENSKKRHEVDYSKEDRYFEEEKEVKF